MELYKDIEYKRISNNKPYRVESNKIIMSKDICEKYGFHTNRYESLYVKDKFISASLIISYHIVNSINNIGDAIADRKEEYNKEYNKKYGKSKSARDTKKTMLDGLQSIIDFNENNFFRLVERLNLVKELYEDIMNKDYITGKYSLDSIKKQADYFKNIIKVPREVVDDFITYSKSKIHKTKDTSGINFDKENSIVLDVVNSKSI